jgi:hypothetical protein
MISTTLMFSEMVSFRGNNIAVIELLATYGLFCRTPNT